MSSKVPHGMFDEGTRVPQVKTERKASIAKTMFVMAALFWATGWFCLLFADSDAYEYIKSGWPVPCAVSVASSDPAAGAKVAASVSGFVDPFDGLELGYLRTDFSEALSKWFRTTPPQGIFLFIR